MFHWMFRRGQEVQSLGLENEIALLPLKRDLSL